MLSLAWAWVRTRLGMAIVASVIGLFTFHFVEVSHLKTKVAGLELSVEVQKNKKQELLRIMVSQKQEDQKRIDQAEKSKEKGDLAVRELEGIVLSGRAEQVRLASRLRKAQSTNECANTSVPEDIKNEIK